MAVKTTLLGLMSSEEAALVESQLAVLARKLDDSASITCGFKKKGKLTIVEIAIRGSKGNIMARVAGHNPQRTFKKALEQTEERLLQAMYAP